MSGHFRAFSFVDRISTTPHGADLEGFYDIPPGLETFRSSLVAEAVGQLAAWGAMRDTDFQRRPIAGLAGRIDLLSSARPGHTLQLSACIQSLDDDAISYHGAASLDGAVVLRLEDCVGPMIEVTELDDPVALRQRYEVLTETEAPTGAFQGLPPMALDITGGEPGNSVTANFQIPVSAPLFADHFPHKPVFPGSLLMEKCLELADALAEQIPPSASGRWTPQSVLNMKLREFLPPGRNLELEARLKRCAKDSAMLLLSAKAGGELVGSVKVILAPGGCL